MRIWVLALIVVIAAAVAGAYFYFSASDVTVAARSPQAAQMSQPAPAGTMMQRSVRQANEAYRNHRQQFQTVSTYSQRARENWIVGLFGFAVFVLLTIPKNFRGVRAFYRQMMEREPLSSEAGATDGDNRQARKVLFFYLLFLLYQLVAFPLTLGHDKGIPFYADLIFQSALLLAVVVAFHGLKRGLHERWKADPTRQEKMDHWLGEKLEGINIRWRDIRMLAVGVFVAGFTPAALSHLTGWLDAASAVGGKMAGN